MLRKRGVMDEQEAISKMKQGEIDALEPLVTKYQHRAMHAAYLITRDRILAEDIVQQAFIRAFERIQQLHPDRSFGPWFLQSVVNDAKKAANRHRRTVSFDSNADHLQSTDYGIDPALGPEEIVAGLETREELWAALGALPPNQQAAIVLRYFLDLPEVETAERLGSRPGTIKWRLHAARQRLRQTLTRANSSQSTPMTIEEPPHQ